MRSLITVFLLFISTISFTLADYSVTYPGTGSVLKKGTQVTVQWTVTKATDTLVNVILAKGPASNLQTVLYLCKDINPQAGKCTFTVGSLTSDVDYAIIVGKDPNHYGYSSFFSIQSNGPLPEAKGCPNFGGQNCPSSLPCCSSSGYCGASAEHCGTGCVAKFSFNGQCKEPGSSGSTKPAQTTKTTQTTKPTQSSNNLCGSVKCTSDLPCCSEYNYCGASSSHCGTGCQPGKSFGGKCLIPNSTTTSKPKQQTCGGKMCNKKNPCCYKNQKCGNTKSFCVAGCQKQRSFNGKCQLK